MFVCVVISQDIYKARSRGCFFLVRVFISTESVSECVNRNTSVLEYRSGNSVSESFAEAAEGESNKETMALVIIGSAVAAINVSAQVLSTCLSHLTRIAPRLSIVQNRDV